MMNLPLNLTKEEMQAAKERFNQLDRDRKGHITVNDIRRYFRVSNSNKSVHHFAASNVRFRTMGTKLTNVYFTTC